MPDRRWPVARLFSIIALALAGVLATAGIAAADTETGEHGNYLFLDTHDTPGARCIYEQAPDFWRLVAISVRPPSLWWWDRNETNMTEHGTVGYRALIKVSLAGAYGPFDLALRSAIQKKTAYEDHPPYDPADKAALTRIRLDFDPRPYRNHPNAHIVVDVKAFWYRKDGSLAGTALHRVDNYEWRNVPGMPVSTTACPIRHYPN